MPDVGSSESLESIKDGIVPECRMKEARGAQSLVSRLIDKDRKRSRKRAMVDGLCDGNAPLSDAKLREANRADAANFNDGTGRAFLESGAGAIYDLSTEAPGRIQIDTSHGNSEQRVDWSRIMSQKADLMFFRDKSWDSREQTSQNETVLHGTGPYYFDDGHVVLPRAIPTGNLLIPDFAPSDVEEWEEAVILDQYMPPRLYSFIRNEEAAAKVGWNVEHTKMVIEYAMDQQQPANRNRDWEWFQNQLKTNSIDYVDGLKVCKLAHVFCKEFDGRITHGIVEEADTSGMGIKWLFHSIGRYASWYEAIHPMYFDKGRAGLHHNVTGLGVKMLGMMTYKNRLFLNLCDKAFAPKILFKPTSAEAATKFQLTRFGDWGLLPPGTEAVQTPIQGFLQDGLAMYRTSDEMLRSNLSQYRTPVEPDKPGNPDTAMEVRMKASQSGSLANTTFSRYYKQLDLLYSEIVRRLCNLNSTDARAKEFQKRCTDSGVPRECFGRIESVQAVRVIGQGSPFMRQQVTQTMMGMFAHLPETGQANLMDDFIASHAGQSAVSRYNPRSVNMSTLVGDQKERANNQIANAKVGMMPTPSPSQNPLIFAGLFLQAATQAVSTVKQGADPRQVVQFLDIIGPAIHAHLKRMQNDPLRKQAAELLEKQTERLGKITDQLKKMIAQKAQQQKQQQAKTQQVMSDQQIKEYKVRGDLNLKSVKLRHSMATKDATTRQNLALNDARTSSEISLSHFRALNE